ncbi:hypothetical protein O181_035649 [Austropuccinia psidii MF-1]|uniref:Uncharacterized protein n=1 Tax=Austropuccinia psidii MF-1 TaxID=1389203 RepID=A0A9Q3D319_9BASI|nr:hypothetical protein [Austropuccinia psidii MF-1]
MNSLTDSMSFFGFNPQAVCEPGKLTVATTHIILASLQDASGSSLLEKLALEMTGVWLVLDLSSPIWQEYTFWSERAWAFIPFRRAVCNLARPQPHVVATSPV